MQFFEFDTVGSTNSVARDLLREGQTAPFWVRAEAQAEGRGRRGRVWISRTGNFYGSAAYPWAGSAQDAAKVSFVAAVAVQETLCAYHPEPLPRLKWPNDVLVSGAKICGILLENSPEGLVVGIGINLTHHPDDTERPATHLLAHISHEHLNTPEPVFSGAANMLPLLASNFDRWMQLYLREGFAPIRAAWLARADGIPGPVTVRLPQETFAGQAFDFAPDGALRVARPDGTIVDVHAGDVFWGEPHATGD